MSTNINPTSEHSSQSICEAFMVQQALHDQTYTVDYRVTVLRQCPQTPKGFEWTDHPFMQIKFRAGDFHSSTQMPLDEFRKLGEEAGKAKLLADMLDLIRAYIRPHVSLEAIMERRADLMRRVAEADAMLVHALKMQPKGEAA